MTTTDDVIEELVKIAHGASDAKTQHQYRTNLRILVELAKVEQKQEMVERPAGSASRMLH